MTTATATPPLTTSAKTVHAQTILAYGMNGGDLPVAHGAPVRLRLGHPQREARPRQAQAEAEHEHRAEARAVAPGGQQRHAGRDRHIGDIEHIIGERPDG